MHKAVYGVWNNVKQSSIMNDVMFELQRSTMNGHWWLIGWLVYWNFVEEGSAIRNLEQFFTATNLLDVQKDCNTCSESMKVLLFLALHSISGTCLSRVWGFKHSRFILDKLVVMALKPYCFFAWNEHWHWLKAFDSQL